MPTSLFPFSFFPKGMERREASEVGESLLAELVRPTARPAKTRAPLVKGAGAARHSTADKPALSAQT
jgi:hypothetical protein